MFNLRLQQRKVLCDLELELIDQVQDRQITILSQFIYVAAKMKISLSMNLGIQNINRQE